MLISDIAVIMNLITIALLGFLVSALLLSITWRLIDKFVDSYSIQSQKVLILMWVSGPWILGLMTMLFFSPIFENTAIYRWVDNVVHWHSFYVFQLDSWHGVTIILFTLFSLALIVIRGSGLYRQGDALLTLSHFSNTVRGSKCYPGLQIIDSNIPTAFTSGLFRPVCYVSKGLIENLTDSELNIVVKHELAHARNKDPLSKTLIAFLSAYYPRKLAQGFNAKYALVTEFIADQSTATVYAAEDVAATLVKVARLQKAFPQRQSNTSQSYFGSHDITHRVQQLLTPTNKPMPLIVPIAFMSAMLCLTIFTVDATHHLVESIFTHS